MNQQIDLQSLGFTFAVDNLDARIGTVEATKISWRGTDGAKTKTQIKLVPCDALEPLRIPLSNEFHQARSGNLQNSPGYLCPDVSSDPDLLRIQGGYNNEHFDYIKLSVKHCKTSDLLEPGESCAAFEEIHDQKSLRLYLPESSVNYESRDTERAVEWSLHNFFILQLEPA